MKGFLPGPDPDAQRFYSSDSLIVDVASPRYLLAMKLFAARAEIDADDIILLYRQLGFTGPSKFTVVVLLLGYSSWCRPDGLRSCAWRLVCRRRGRGGAG